MLGDHKSLCCFLLFSITEDKFEAIRAEFNITTEDELVALVGTIADTLSRDSESLDDETLAVLFHRLYVIFYAPDAWKGKVNQAIAESKLISEYFYNL